MEIWGYQISDTADGLSVDTNLGTIYAHNTTKNWLATYRLFRIKDFNRAAKFVEDVNRWGLNTFNPDNPEET